MTAVAEWLFYGSGCLKALAAMRGPKDVILCVLAGLFAVLAGQVHAAMPSFDDSVELAAANSDCVVVGTIKSAEQIASPSARIASPDPWWKVTVDVQEALVGAPSPEVVFWVPAGGRAATTAPSTSPMLFCLVKGERYKSVGRSAFPIYEDVPLTTQALDFSSLGYHKPPISLALPDIARVPNVRMTRCASRDELIAGVRPYCRRPLSLARCELVATPWYSYPTGWPAVVFVPLDEDMDRLARTWATSTDDTVRWNAVRVLRHTKSAENLECLRTIAAEPTGNERREVTREVALVALQGWGERPSLRRSAGSWFEPSRARFWLSLLGLMLLPAAYALRYWRSPCRASRLRLTLMLLWLTVVSLLGVVWARSYSALDGVGGGNHEIGAVDANLYLATRGRWQERVDRPWAYTRAADLPEVVFGSTLDWTWDRQDPLRAFRGGRRGAGSYMEDTFPYWCNVLTWRVPLWLPTCILLLPPLATRIYRVCARRRRARRPGFEVIVCAPPEKINSTS